MKKHIQRLVDLTIIKAVRYVKDRSPANVIAPDNLYKIIWDRAALTSADYVESKLDNALLFSERQALWDHAFSKMPHEGIFAEFGVFEGHSINYFAEKLQPRNLTIYGFDSFEGLKEDWFGTDAPVNAFDRGGALPTVLPNVTLVKGWFDQTIPSFLQSHPEKAAFLHLDADTYESTALVLEQFKDRITQGTVLIFDEYLGIPNWQNHEFRAWQEFVSNNGLCYEYLGFSLRQAAVIVT